MWTLHFAFWDDIHVEREDSLKNFILRFEYLQLKTNGLAIYKIS